MTRNGFVFAVIESDTNGFTIIGPYCCGTGSFVCPIMFSGLALHVPSEMPTSINSDCDKKVKCMLHWDLAPIQVNMLKGASGQFIPSGPRAAHIGASGSRGPCMLVLISPTSEEWKAE